MLILKNFTLMTHWPSPSLGALRCAALRDLTHAKLDLNHVRLDLNYEKSKINYARSDCTNHQRIVHSLIFRDLHDNNYNPIQPTTFKLRLTQILRLLISLQVFIFNGKSMTAIFCDF